VEGVEVEVEVKIEVGAWERDPHPTKEAVFVPLTPAQEKVVSGKRVCLHPLVIQEGLVGEMGEL
jgi:hypothetical protein